ncbi:MAG: nicotinate-nucleotide adenylyltransferase [Bryobacteraceae bacterium]
MKLALFGGTFDPIHNAHLTIAREALERFGLDRILFITSASPPHKSNAARTPYEHRHRMVELACQDEPRFIPSRIEEGTERSYSILTIEKILPTLGPGDSLYFLIGADAFAEIETWYRADDVLRLIDFIVVSRPGHEYRIPPGARVHRLETLALPVSSSDIRSRLRSGHLPPDLPPAAAAYIREHGLYGISSTRHDSVTHDNVQ